MGIDDATERADFESIARKHGRSADEFDIYESKDPFVLPGQITLVSHSRTVTVRHRGTGLVRTYAAARWLVQFEHDIEARIFS